MPEPISISGCGCEHDASLPEIDARRIPHAIRHGAILGAIDQLPSGGALVLVAPHDPKPLLAQATERFPGLQVDYLATGPEAWRLQLTKA